MTGQGEDERSSISDELDVPPSMPAVDAVDHMLPAGELNYPTLVFEEGTVSPATGIKLRESLDRPGIKQVLEDLGSALTSHDLCVEGPDRRAIFGIGPGDVSISFEPDEDHLGTLSISIDLKAKALTYADADARHVGARGGCGFIPKAMLTGDIDAEAARCYNWIDDPTEHLDSPEP